MSIFHSLTVISNFKVLSLGHISDPPSHSVIPRAIYCSNSNHFIIRSVVMLIPKVKLIIFFHAQTHACINMSIAINPVYPPDPTFSLSVPLAETRYMPVFQWAVIYHGITGYLSTSGALRNLYNPECS